MASESVILSLENPVFFTYVLAASLMLLKLLLQPWMTVYRMMKVRAGFRSPEDAKKSPLNPTPVTGQLALNEYVERSRRMNLNDLESIPAFLIAGLLFVLIDPPLLLAQVLIWAYVLARAAHFIAYATAQLHDVRATIWTVSSVAVIAMVIYTLVRLFTSAQ
ncbi:MAPEG family protein [Photobacterium sp. WH77]|uniref:MAPEG family protein n=1 Tax=unclassified Photobacterium TaxID=2628852 RepID=UPI001EDB99F2|nr:MULTISPECIES: MAPEG family protein [unclassified Photobacterium]MCG2837416.1 MAPEG family protein [Photobacterium sp. WH77]MCG2845014.1 MAPEG family protein [Photobacterium sp. WH80]